LGEGREGEKNPKIEAGHLIGATPCTGKGFRNEGWREKKKPAKKGIEQGGERKKFDALKRDRNN